MENQPFNRFPLGELIQIIKAKGFGVSIEQIIQIQSLFLSSPVTRTSVHELKYLLAPILAKNDEEQTAIYQLVDDYIASKATAFHPPPGLWKVFAKNKKRLFYLKLAGVLLLAAIAITFYIIQALHPRTEKTSADKPPVENYPKPQNDPADSIPADTRKPGGPNGAQKLPDKAVPFATVTYTEPILLKRKDINLQMSGLFGILLGIILSFFLFEERRRAIDSKRKTRPLSMGGGGRQVNSGEGEHTQTGILLEESEPMPVQFPEKNYVIQRTSEFASIKAGLKQPGIAESRKLNVRKSVYASIRNAGFASPVFDEIVKERRYLVIVEDRPESHLAHLFHYFISFLQAARLPVVKFTYTNDIKLLKGEAGESKTLYEISDQFSDHHLILLGDGRNLLDDEGVIRKNLSSALHRWTAKYVITPAPLKDWSQREEALPANGFVIVPAEIEAINLLVSAITRGTSVQRQELASKIRDNYTVAGIDFDSVAGLKKYLNDPLLFQLVCSLGVYPKLNWNLTLALFSAFLTRLPSAEQSTALSYTTLLKVSRIPWLQKGELDQPLRLQLLTELETANEVIARETLLQLLKEMKSELPPESMVYSEIEVQYDLNAFFLFAHDEWKYSPYGYTKETFPDYWVHLDEWALKERVRQGESGLMPVDEQGHHQSVDDYFLNENALEVRNIKLGRVAALLLPALILYILFSIFQPDLVYDGYGFKNVSFTARLEWDPSCTKKFTSLSVLDQPPVALRAAGEETIAIRNVNPDLPVKLEFRNNKGAAQTIEIGAKNSTATITLVCK